MSKSSDELRQALKIGGSEKKKKKKEIGDMVMASTSGACFFWLHEEIIS